MLLFVAGWPLVSFPLQSVQFVTGRKGWTSCKPPWAPNARRQMRANQMVKPPTCRETGTRCQEEQNILSAINDYRNTVSSPKHVIQATHACYSALRELLSDLENTTGFSISKQLRRNIPGNWRLIITDANAVIRNAGSITGLSNLPLCSCETVDVCLERNGQARTIESLKLFGATSSSNSLVGKWQVVGPRDDILEVTYADANLFGKFSLRANSKAVLRTTYCSQGLRVGRSRSGNFYIFAKQE